MKEEEKGLFRRFYDAISRPSPLPDEMQRGAGGWFAPALESFKAIVRERQKEIGDGTWRNIAEYSFDDPYLVFLVQLEARLDARQRMLNKIIEFSRKSGDALRHIRMLPDRIAYPRVFDIGRFIGRWRAGITADEILREKSYIRCGYPRPEIILELYARELDLIEAILAAELLLDESPARSSESRPYPE